jgi:hypothetical protein
VIDGGVSVGGVVAFQPGVVDGATVLGIVGEVAGGVRGY